MHLTWVCVILAIVMLTGFTGFWEPKSFEECRDRAARAKTDAGVKALILSCRERFPKQSQLQTEWLEFSKALVGYKFDPNVPITRKTPIRYTELSRAESTKGNPSSRTSNSKRSWVLTEEQSRRLEEMAEDRAYQSTPRKVKSLKSVEFINWFVSQPGHIKSLLVIPMLEENERKIFDAYNWR